MTWSIARSRGQVFTPHSLSILVVLVHFDLREDLLGPVPNPGQSLCWGEGIRTVLYQATDLWPPHAGERSLSPKDHGG